MSDSPTRRPTPSSQMAFLADGNGPGHAPLDDDVRDELLRRLVTSKERIDRELDVLVQASVEQSTILQDIKSDHDVINSDLGELNRKVDYLQELLVKLLLHNGIDLPQM